MIQRDKKKYKEEIREIGWTLGSSSRLFKDSRAKVLDVFGNCLAVSVCSQQPWQT